MKLRYLKLIAGLIAPKKAQLSLDFFEIALHRHLSTSPLLNANEKN